MDYEGVVSLDGTTHSVDERQGKGEWRAHTRMRAYGEGRGAGRRAYLGRHNTQR